MSRDFRLEDHKSGSLSLTIVHTYTHFT